MPSRPCFSGKPMFVSVSLQSSTLLQLLLPKYESCGSYRRLPPHPTAVVLYVGGLPEPLWLAGCQKRGPTYPQYLYWAYCHSGGSIRPLWESGVVHMPIGSPVEMVPHLLLLRQRWHGFCLSWGTATHACCTPCSSM